MRRLRVLIVSRHAESCCGWALKQSREARQSQDLSDIVQSHIMAAVPTDTAPAGPVSWVHTSAAPDTLRTLSRSQDPQAADAAAKTIALAMSNDGRHDLFSKGKEAYYDYWFAIAHNYQLRMLHTTPFIHVLQDAACASYCYWYPEQRAGDGPEPAGLLDITKWTAPDANSVRATLLAFLDEGRSQFLKDRGAFLYLAFLSVRPEHQGKGLGGTMLRYLCHQADVAGKWSYLEASNNNNARLYERHGFVRTGRQQTFNRPGLIESDAFTIIVMARPPSALNSKQ